MYTGYHKSKSSKKSHGEVVFVFLYQVESVDRVDSNEDLLSKYVTNEMSLHFGYNFKKVFQNSQFSLLWLLAYETQSLCLSSDPIFDSVAKKSDLG